MKNYKYKLEKNQTKKRFFFYFQNKFLQRKKEAVNLDLKPPKKKMSSQSESTNRDKEQKDSKNILEEALVESTVHGIPHMIKSNNFLLKTMWLVLCSCSLVYGSYAIYQEVNTFLNYPVISLTRVQYVQSLNLPILTICSLNPFATKYAKETILTMQNNSVVQFSKGSPIFSYMNAQFFASMNTWANVNESSRKKFGMSLKESVLSCVFNWEECDLDRDFKEFYDPFNGNCFRYNFDRSKVVSFSGMFIYQVLFYRPFFVEYLLVFAISKTIYNSILYKLKITLSKS
jgi:hypothetical protein